MDLRTFVSETLTQIVAGVTDAQQKLGEMGTNAVINPTRRDASVPHKIGDPKPVRFDVALTVADEARDSSMGKASAKASLLSVVGLSAAAELGAEAHEEKRSETISRVQFEVSLAQPAAIQEYTMARPPTPRTPWS